MVSGRVDKWQIFPGNRFNDAVAAGSDGAVTLNSLKFNVAPDKNPGPVVNQ